MKLIKPFFSLILICVSMNMVSARAAAPAPMPPEPTINDVASYEKLELYTKSMIEYLRAAPPYYDPRDDKKTNNLNEMYADFYERWIASRNSGNGTFSEKCENGKCTTYVFINNKGYCTLSGVRGMLPTESDDPMLQPTGPIEAYKEFILNKLSKMYDYTINHTWPVPQDTIMPESPEKGKEASRKMQELSLAAGLIGPSTVCNGKDRFAGCTLIFNKIVDEGYHYTSKPCI